MSNDKHIHTLDKVWIHNNQTQYATADISILSNMHQPNIIRSVDDKGKSFYLLVEGGGTFSSLSDEVNFPPLC